MLLLLCFTLIIFPMDLFKGEEEHPLIIKAKTIYSRNMHSKSSQGGKAFTIRCLPLTFFLAFQQVYYTNVLHINSVMYRLIVLTMFLVSLSKCIPYSYCFWMPQSWPLDIILNKSYNLVVRSEYLPICPYELSPLALTQLFDLV